MTPEEQLLDELEFDDSELFTFTNEFKKIYHNELKSILLKIDNKQFTSAKDEIDCFQKTLPVDFRSKFDVHFNNWKEDLSSIDIFEKYLQKHETNPHVESFYYVTVLFELYQKCMITHKRTLQMLETHFFRVVKRFSDPDIAKKKKNDPHLKFLINSIKDYAIRKNTRLVERVQNM
jgi:hypothetical protein